MYDIITAANELLKSHPLHLSEILYELVFYYEVKKDGLPDGDCFISLMGDIPSRDSLFISVQASGETIHIGSIDWKNKYVTFIEELYENETITVSFRINKTVYNGTLSIYSIESFSQFITNLRYEQIFENFTDLFFKAGDTIWFHLMQNSVSSLSTNSIAFSNNQIEWITCVPRNIQLQNCYDATVFLDKTRIALLPQDFMIIDQGEGTDLDEIRRLFIRMNRILSYLFLSNSSYIIREKAVLQFDPSSPAEEYDMNELSQNKTISQIYDWAFKGDNCVDKACIVRKMINVYCNTKEGILGIDQNVFNYVKSNYIMYQKNHVDQYIDLKNKISEFIVDNSRQLQDITHGIMESLGNNIIALLVFLMTVLLTDSFDFSQFFANKVSPNITAVCGAFTVASILYLLVTHIISAQKWSWVEDSYNDLKDNYKGILDNHDVEEAFKNDKPIITIRNQYQSFKKRIFIIWTIMIVMLVIFTFTLTNIKHNNSSTITSVQSDIDASTGKTAVPSETNTSSSFSTGVDQ